MKRLFPIATTLTLAGILVSCGVTSKDQTSLTPNILPPTTDEVQMGKSEEASPIPTSVGIGDVELNASTGVTLPASTTPATGLSSDVAIKRISKIVEYKSPAGKEEIQVTIEMVNNIISYVSATPMASHEISKKMQAKFTANIGVAVGKPVKEFKIDTVGGASLTTRAFNAYIQSL